MGDNRVLSVILRNYPQFIHNLSTIYHNLSTIYQIKHRTIHPCDTISQELHKTHKYLLQFNVTCSHIQAPFP